MKKICVLAPVMSYHEQSEGIRKMLAFLEPFYELKVIDPLLELSTLDNKSYYNEWQKKLCVMFPKYDAFIGFSFGAVIIQQCFPAFERHYNLDKPIVLFSAPAFSDDCLSERLDKVIKLAQKCQLADAYELLMTQVSYPYMPGDLRHSYINPDLACARLIEGLTRVRSTDSRTVLSASYLKHYHFIGEQSYLVNKNHILNQKNAKLIVVPNAGMRVLQDNIEFCHRKIGEILL